MDHANYVVIFAGGVGSRMNGAKTPKQFLELGGKPIIAHTIDHFERHPLISGIIVACLESGIPFMEQIITTFHYEKVISVAVSYTHLDVYKRQHQRSARLI